MAKTGSPLTKSGTFATAAIREVVGKIRKKFGSHAIITADTASFIKIVRLPTGVDALDFAIGGGYPFGRFIHIYGPEGVAKTFLAMKAAAQIHAIDPKAIVVWNDLERIFDYKRAKQIGVDLRRLELIPADSAEHSFGIMEEFVATPEVRLYVVDSVAAVSAMSEMEGEMSDQQVGAAPRVMNKFFRRWLAKNTPKENKPPHSLVLLLNQVREKVGGYSPRGAPKPQPPGGRGMRSFPSLIIEVTKGQLVQLNTADDDNDKITIGHEVKFLVEKNNTFPPKRAGKFLLCTRPYEIGGYKIRSNDVDNPRDLLRFARYYGVIEESGKWLTFRDDRWNGRVEAQTQLALNPEIAEAVKLEVMNAIEEKLGVYRDQEAVEEESSARKTHRRSGRRKNKTRKRKQVA